MADALSHRQAGFSLLEAMGALVVLTVGCAGVIGLLVLADQAAAQSAAADAASAMVREVMEQSRTLSYDDLMLAARAGEEVIGPYRRRWELRPGEPAAGLATLMVEVTWQEARGRTRRLALGMVRADPGAG